MFVIGIYKSHPLDVSHRPASWRVIDLVGVGKEPGWDRLTHLRWIGLLVLQKAYTSTCLRLARDTLRPRCDAMT